MQLPSRTDAVDPGDGPLVCLHIDDLGMCHGANLAFALLSRSGGCDCGSVMVPCPWFAELAALATAEPALDVGVHLTLTAEKRHYRWRPLTGGRGLADPDGFMWRSVELVRRHAEPGAVEAELRAQIDRALAAGIDVTHLDDHMGAVFAPEFVELYVRLGRDYRLPILFPRSMAAYGPIHNLPGAPDERLHAGLAAALAAEGALLADRVLETPWRRDRPVAERYRDLFGQIGAGFSFMALHANLPGEIEAIEPDTAAIRIEEHEFLAGPLPGRWLGAIGARRTGMRAVRDRLRHPAPSAGARMSTVLVQEGSRSC